MSAPIPPPEKVSQFRGKTYISVEYDGVGDYSDEWIDNVILKFYQVKRLSIKGNPAILDALAARKKKNVNIFENLDFFELVINWESSKELDHEALDRSIDNFFSEYTAVVQFKVEIASGPIKKMESCQWPPVTYNRKSTLLFNCRNKYHKKPEIFKKRNNSNYRLPWNVMKSKEAREVGAAIKKAKAKARAVNAVKG